MEYLSQYEYSIHYINGETNCIVDALSRYPETIACNNPPPALPITSIFEVNSDPSFLDDICTGYVHDVWCSRLISDVKNKKLDFKLDVSLCNGLLFTGNHLIIPHFKGLREQIFCLAHNNLGHFGGDKTYENLHREFYWPHMQRDLIQGYIPSCSECQRNKSRMTKPAGPLHPLAIPDGHFQSVAMDFVGPLPMDDGFDCILTLTDRMGADIQIILCQTDMGAEEIAGLFFDQWYCENGCPVEIISDWDKIFMSKFWRSIMHLSRIKHKMSTAYHPQTDGSSECSNKTIIQCICFHVDRQQKGWSKVLRKIRFDIMNSVNVSMGYAPFMLKSGHHPHLIPLLIQVETTAMDSPASNSVPLPAGFSQGMPEPTEASVSTPVPLPGISSDRTDELEYMPAALSFMEDLRLCLADASDSLFATKLSQALHTNTSCGPDLDFKVGNKVLLSTENRRREYTQKKEGRVAKFMPCYDGPYTIVKAFSKSSMYTLHLPASSHVFPFFHVSLLKKFNVNDLDLFSEHELAKPGPIVTADGQDEYFIEKILDEWKCGCGRQYLIHWLGYGPESDLWLPRSELLETEALKLWEERNCGR